MNKKRVFLSWNRRDERWHRFRNYIAHSPTMNFDLMFEGKDGKISVVDVKGGAGMSNAVFLIGAGHSFVEGASERLFLLHLHERDFDMPDRAQKLLPFIVPRKLRANVAGDLAEEFRDRAKERGRQYALCVLWWDIAGLALRRFGPAGIITAVAMWFRQKLGW